MADDANRRALHHASEAFARVSTEVQNQFLDGNFNVINEDIWLADLRWERGGRKGKGQLAEMIKRACLSGDEAKCPRAMVALRVRAYAEDLGYGTAVSVRVAGDMFDTRTNKFLGGWEHPIQEYPAPRNCDGVCAEEIVGQHARDLATIVADTLRGKLASLTSSAGGYGDVGGGGGEGGLINQYLVTFKNFSKREYLTITDVMENEFPKFVKFGTESGTPPLVKVNYFTRAKTQEIARWMNVLLLDLEIPENHFKVLVLNNAREILVERTINNGAPSVRPSRRFE